MLGSHSSPALRAWAHRSSLRCDPHSRSPSGIHAAPLLRSRPCGSSLMSIFLPRNREYVSAVIGCASRPSLDRLLVGARDRLLDRPLDEWLTAGDDVVGDGTEGCADEPPERRDLFER